MDITAPNLCGRTLLRDQFLIVHLSETTVKVPTSSPSQKTLPVINVTGVVRVLKQDETYPFAETYWTETVDISARTYDGRKLFEFFHISTVPEGEFSVFRRLRRQALESWISELEDSMNELCNSTKAGFVGDS